MVLAGVLSAEMIEMWRQDYSILLSEKLNSMWTKAIKAGPGGQPILDNVLFEFNTQTPGIFEWIRERGANFVTVCTKEQQEAIAALLTKKMCDTHTVDELARMIRPCIGLTKGQAAANARYYDSIVANLRKDHPRMKPESAKKKAREAAHKYAERQHRDRAFTIAQTECAFAYNRGADYGIRQAQEQGYLGVMKKRWSTSGDDAVCTTCSALEGTEIDMDSDFNFGGKVLFPGHHMLPPAHPRCACAVEYIEIEPLKYVDVPQMNVSITENNSFREYSDEEIHNIANQTETVASKHIETASKWSGNIIISDDGVTDTSGHKVYYGKMWDCNIVTRYETAPGIILHEQIHARSISYFGREAYNKYQKIEEASVQLLTQEISKIEGIEIIESGYDVLVDVLRKIGRFIGIHNSDYEFAKFIISTPVTERLGWISDNIYDILGHNENATIEEYQKWSALLDTLYTKG